MCIRALLPNIVSGGGGTVYVKYDSEAQNANLWPMKPTVLTTFGGHCSQLTCLDYENMHNDLAIIC